MLDRTEDVSISARRSAEDWLTRFEIALEHSNEGVLRPLFHLDSFWRDVLALS